MQGWIYSHLVNSIGKCSVDHLDIDSINSLVFCSCCLITKLHPIQRHIYDIEYMAFFSAIVRYKIRVDNTNLPSKQVLTSVLTKLK